MYPILHVAALFFGEFTESMIVLVFCSALSEFVSYLPMSNPETCN